jgi:hypothetical protein
MDVVLFFCFMGMCLSSRCPEKALVYPPISRSFHSKGSTRYKMKISIVYMSIARVFSKLEVVHVSLHISYVAHVKAC